jgi:hypothetical protein
MALEDRGECKAVVDDHLTTIDRREDAVSDEKTDQLYSSAQATRNDVHT